MLCRCRLNTSFLSQKFINTHSFQVSLASPAIKSFNHIRFSSSAPEHPRVPPPKKSLTRRFFRLFAIGPKLTYFIKKTSLVEDEDLVRLISTTGSLSVYTFIVAAILNSNGVDTTPFIAGFSVAGAAIGFGLREVAQTYLTGILMIVNRQFENGATVTVGGSEKFTGTVDKLDLRHLVIIDKEKHVVFIPTSIVFANPIIVHSDSKHKIISD
eukprot:c12031_g1_i1.p1 GENE.c12031_g1_i1~~c12031_g1_i1.p1  ORF type:complete len:232 (+),score=77.66 c12031_g1_i1:62-697(+)